MVFLGAENAQKCGVENFTNLLFASRGIFFVGKDLASMNVNSFPLLFQSFNLTVTKLTEYFADVILQNVLVLSVIMDYAFLV